VRLVRRQLAHGSRGASIAPAASIWYFAYGSNLWTEQLVARIGPLDDAADKPRIARLANYRLVFQHLDVTSAAYADIVTPGDGVIGVVYRCTSEQLDRLDIHEGGYDRQAVTVIDEQGESLSAMVYIMTPTPSLRFGKPTNAYLRKILRGAREHHLPEAYMRQIEAIAQSGENKSEG